ncbi:nucleotidyltransferase domain-containing protein [Robiginitomaculum antarcticum]|uniref:nucleotidyltransferase domain-containing protein n=1 Tax=Robiginitomaculum antarcticum TaxID=437507 RepID=UPI0003703C46|nr:nucleotidyltransferase domain-containing protein [Robiginitomaculum antarcticum]
MNNLIHPDIDPAIHAEILKRLVCIEQGHDVKIICAIESGSRAWGFPSPNSDYDTRFIYVHRKDWYLSLNPGRDVIELPIDADYDINGWDLKKALGLLLKSNPVMLEWLSSPIRYIWQSEDCAKLVTFAKTLAHRKACLHHYVRLGQSCFKDNISGRDKVKLKKYFYAIRPALAIHWLRDFPDKAPPMNIFDIMDKITVPSDMKSDLDHLLALKRAAKETGMGWPIASIDNYCAAQFKWAQSFLKDYDPIHVDREQDANLLFLNMIHT